MRRIKNRILWILNHHASGPGRHESFARWLGGRGWQVRLIASSFVHNVSIESRSYQPGCFSIEEIGTDFSRIWIKTPPYRGNGLSRSINHLAFAYRATKLGLGLDRPDIIIGSSAHLLTGLAAFCLAKKHRAPFVFEVRDIWPKSLIDIGAIAKFSPLTLAMGWLEKFLYRKAALIISVLPGGVDYVIGLGIDQDKVVFIPNGVDLAWYDRCNRENSLTPDQAALFAKIKGRVVFTYAGAHGYANGLESIVNAAGYLQRTGFTGIHILLVGDGPSKASLVMMAREQGLTNLTFMDAQDKGQVPVILKNSDVCLFHLRNSQAYRYGLSSNKLFDYMAAAKPIIATLDPAFMPGINKFVQLVQSDNPVALAQAMVQMAGEQPETRDKMGFHAQEYVQKLHNTPVLADKLQEALERFYQ